MSARLHGSVEASTRRCRSKRPRRRQEKRPERRRQDVQRRTQDNASKGRSAVNGRYQDSGDEEETTSETTTYNRGRTPSLQLQALGHLARDCRQPKKTGEDRDGGGSRGRVGSCNVSADRGRDKRHRGLGHAPTRVRHFSLSSRHQPANTGHQVSVV